MDDVLSVIIHVIARQKTTALLEKYDVSKMSVSKLAESLNRIEKKYEKCEQESKEMLNITLASMKSYHTHPGNNYSVESHINEFNDIKTKNEIFNSNTQLELDIKKQHLENEIMKTSRLVELNNEILNMKEEMKNFDVTCDELKEKMKTALIYKREQYNIAQAIVKNYENYKNDMKQYHSNKKSIFDEEEKEISNQIEFVKKQIDELERKVKNERVKVQVRSINEGSFLKDEVRMSQVSAFEIMDKLVERVDFSMLQYTYLSPLKILIDMVLNKELTIDKQNINEYYKDNCSIQEQNKHKKLLDCASELYAIVNTIRKTRNIIFHIAIKNNKAVKSDIAFYIEKLLLDDNIHEILKYGQP